MRSYEVAVGARHRYGAMIQMRSGAQSSGEAIRYSAWSLPTVRRTCRRDAHGYQLFPGGLDSRVIRRGRRGACD